MPPVAWIASSRQAAGPVRRGRLLALLALAAFAAVTWFCVPHGIGSSWRECDTQAIARNFLHEGFDPLRPRVDWRGDTDGAVECEFPFYQLSIASLMAVVGEAEWPGRLLSLLAMVWAGFMVHRLFEMRAGPGGALAGLVAFLASGSSVMLATRVMPDAFALAFGVASVAVFVRYLATGSGLSLLLAVGALSLASLQKPLALQLGLVWFGWTLVMAPRRLTEPRIWFAFGSVLILVAAWLAHGKALYEETGLSFGVLVGDTKFPALEHLLSPKIHAQLAWTAIQYGVSALGLLAIAVLAVRRRIDRSDVVLLAATALGLYVSLRYSYHHRMGPHYHMFAAFAGAWCVARAWPARGPVPPWPLWAALALAIGLQGAWRVGFEAGERSGVVETQLMDIAASIRRLSEPDDLVVMRGRKPRVDPIWERRNNYENPSLFYQAQRRGWVLPADGFDVAALEDLRRRGARFVCDAAPSATTAAVSRWLDQHAESVLDAPNWRVHRLHTMP